jgi:plasmid stabilization system protein ParE
MLNIEATIRFEEELTTILDFIAQDNQNQALKFYDELFKKINILKDNPYISRQREGLDTNYRELIFKGYTIPYWINNNTIFILGIFNQNIWE